MNEKININYDKENGKYELTANVDTPRTILGDWLCHASKILYTQYHYLNELIDILDEIAKSIESELHINIVREDEDGNISYFKPLYVDRDDRHHNISYGGKIPIRFGQRQTLIILSFPTDSSSNIFISVYNRDCEPGHFRTITTYINIRIREDEWPDVCIEHHDSDDDIGQRIIDILTTEKVCQLYRIVETNNDVRDTKESVDDIDIEDIIPEDDLKRIITGYCKQNNYSKCKYSETLGCFFIDDSKELGITYFVDHYNIWTNDPCSDYELCRDEYYNPCENVNIKIYPNMVIEMDYAENYAFGKEFMRGLYLKIKEYVEGNNKEDNEPSESTDTTHESDSEQMNDENITEENETNNVKLFKINLVDHDGYRNDYIIYANSIDDAWNRFWKYIDTLDEYDDCGHFNIMDKSDYEKSNDRYGKYYGKNHVTDHHIAILIEEVYFNDNGLVHIKGPGSEYWEDVIL